MAGRSDRQRRPALSPDPPGGQNKAGTLRVVPVGQRLGAVLEMLRTDPAGEPLGPDAFVFGDEAGGSIASVKTAWRTVCAKVGIADPHFPDLRREFACRLFESRAELHDVPDFLGHANITTTSRYLRSTTLRFERALSRLEQGEKRDKPAEMKRGARTIPERVPHWCHTEPLQQEDDDRFDSLSA